jgi:class 3 adenylate cyclase
LDKFIGDGFMAFWGAPVTKGRQEDAIDAARFALEVRKEFQLIATRWKTSGLDKQIRLRLGLHSGYCSVGNFGSHRRLQFTAMGNPVNVASRLESASKGGHITTSLATQAMLSSQFDLNEKGKIEVKGIKHPLTVFDLVEERQFSSKNNLDQVTAFLSSLEGSTFVDRETLEALRDIATIKRRREGSSETAVAA